MDPRLAKIEHFVLVMMENRSYDHMLGYLSLEGGRSDLNGPTGNEFNLYAATPGAQPAPVRFTPGNGRRVPCDPPHDSTSVALQISESNGGFVKSYMARHGADPRARPDDVMIYYDAATLPVYDFLAREYCVCDSWHASIPGPTWPNRMYAMAGTSQGIRDNKIPPLPGLTFTCLFDLLSRGGVEWRYYESDVGTIRLFANYTNDREHVRLLDQPDEGFFDRAAHGDLPAVTYIDPDFEDVPGAAASDDHPPSHVDRGQAFIARIYQALATSPAWDKTMLVVTYDEHGGFFDHVVPGAAEDDFIPRCGVRVPALVISPYVGRGSSRHEVYDHSSIVRTVINRFVPGTEHELGRRVVHARDLSGVLVSGSARAAAQLQIPGVMHGRVASADGFRAPGPPTELQRLVQELRRRRDSPRVRETGHAVVLGDQV